MGKEEVAKVRQEIVFGKRYGCEAGQISWMVVEQGICWTTARLLIYL